MACIVLLIKRDLSPAFQSVGGWPDTGGPTSGEICFLVTAGINIHWPKEVAGCGTGVVLHGGGGDCLHWCHGRGGSFWWEKKVHSCIYDILDIGGLLPTNVLLRGHDGETLWSV